VHHFSNSSRKGSKNVLISTNMLRALLRVLSQHIWKQAQVEEVTLKIKVRDWKKKKKLHDKRNIIAKKLYCRRLLRMGEVPS
jgi:hypothetical protein